MEHLLYNRKMIETIKYKIQCKFFDVKNPAQRLLKKTLFQ